MGEFKKPSDLRILMEREMVTLRGNLVFTACGSGERFMKRTIEEYNSLSSQVNFDAKVPVVKTEIKHKADGVIIPELTEHVGGADVFIFQNLFDHDKSINDNCMELYTVIRTAKDNGAAHIVPVLRYLAYSRQDRPTPFSREGTLAKLEVNLIEAAGATQVILYDPHFPQIRGFFKNNPTVLSSFSFFYDAFSFLKNRSDAILVSPDVGAYKDNVNLAKELGIDLGVVTKNRDLKGNTEVTGLSGNFDGKFVAGMKDDILAKGDTFYNSARAIYKKGVKEIYGGFSYGQFLGDSVKKLDELHENYGLKKIFIIDNIDQPEEIRNKPWYSEYSIYKEIAMTINAIHYGASVRDNLYRPEFARRKNS